MYRPSRCVAALLAAFCIFAAVPASAFTLKEFRKYTANQQAVYLSGAVSMVAFTYATTGESAKARCVHNWYFGPGDAPGPRQLTLELSVAEDLDPEKYHVEAIILGLTDKVCGSPASTRK